MLGDGRNHNDVVRARFAGVVHANGDICLAARRSSAGAAMARFDRDIGERVLERRPAVSDQAHDVRSDRRQFERGHRGLQFDRRSILDGARNAVRDVEAPLFTRGDVADLRARACKQRRTALFVVKLFLVELSAADEIDQTFGKIKTHAHAGCRRAALITERERRAHGHPRFQLALRRNDEGS